MLTKSLQILSDATVYSKYAAYLPEKNRRETWPEIVERTIGMHRNEVAKDNVYLNQLLDECKQYMLDYKILPSMRSAQFAQRGIEQKNERIYNCAYAPITSPRVYAELVRSLLCGNGTGYSVQKVHIDQYDWTLRPENAERPYVYEIEDHIEGWGDAAEALVRGWVDPGAGVPTFVYKKIREKGALVASTGAKAPGPVPLMKTLQDINSLLEQRAVESLTNPGLKLTSLDLHDIMCLLARCVVAGGIRRSAMISFFDWNDQLMLTCKSKEEISGGRNVHRFKANNSAVLVHGEHGYMEFFSVINYTRESGSGEPGIFWTHDRDMLANPCVEASLYPHQYCNLTTVSAYGIDTQEEFNKRAYYAAVLGTFQSCYTNFTYLGDWWKKQTEKDRLIGVSITGIGLGTLVDKDLSEAARVVVDANREVADILGIEYAARTTLIKPEGTTSCVLGTPSGVHAYEGRHYIRRFTLAKDEPLYGYLKSKVPELVHDKTDEPDQFAYFCFPIEAPEGAFIKSEGVMSLLERVRRYNLEWIRPGHNSGANYHNVSCTGSVRPEDWSKVIDWMWTNRHDYHGISLFPSYGEDLGEIEARVDENGNEIDEEGIRDLFDSGNIFKADYHLILEQIDPKTYAAMMEIIDAAEIDFSEIVEYQDNTVVSQTVACAGGACEVSQL